MTAHGGAMSAACPCSRRLHCITPGHPGPTGGGLLHPYQPVHGGVLLRRRRPVFSGAPGGAAA